MTENFVKFNGELNENGQENGNEKKIKIRENSIDIEHRQRRTNIHIIRMSEEENRQWNTTNI